MTDPRSQLVRLISTEALKAAPPVGVSIYAILTGVMPLIVGLVTLIYLIMQIRALRQKMRWAADDRASALAAGSIPPAVKDFP